MMDNNQQSPTRFHAKAVEITEFSEEVYQTVLRLMSQYAHSRSQFLKYTLCTIINSTSSHLFFLYPEDTDNSDGKKEVWGMATVNICQTCSIPRAWVDDFVIDERYRRHGLAHILMDQILKFAHYLGVPNVMLTTNPSRVAGNSFCKNFGFEIFETNVYQYSLKWGNKGL